MGVQPPDAWAVPWWAYAAVGATWWLGIEGLELAGLAGDAPFYVASTLAFSVFGVLCWYNGRACGAVHCRITGPGFLLAAGLALLGLVGVPGISPSGVMGVFWIVLVGAFVVEWWVERRRGGTAA